MDTSAPFPLMSYGTSRVRAGARTGWAGRHVWPPSTCHSSQQLPLFFSLPEMVIFHRPSQKLSQGLGQAVGGGELRPGCRAFQQTSPPSGLARALLAFRGLKGEPWLHNLTSGAWALL